MLLAKWVKPIIIPSTLFWSKVQSLFQMANQAKNLILGNAQTFHTILFMFVRVSPKHCEL
jgi:hypothetical protein